MKLCFIIFIRFAFIKCGLNSTLASTNPSVFFAEIPRGTILKEEKRNNESGVTEDTLNISLKRLKRGIAKWGDEWENLYCFSNAKNSCSTQINKPNNEKLQSKDEIPKSELNDIKLKFINTQIEASLRLYAISKIIEEFRSGIMYSIIDNIKKFTLKEIERATNNGEKYDCNLLSKIDYANICKEVYKIFYNSLSVDTVNNFLETLYYDHMSKFDRSGKITQNGEKINEILKSVVINEKTIRIFHNNMNKIPKSKRIIALDAIKKILPVEMKKKELSKALNVLLGLEDGGEIENAFKIVFEGLAKDKQNELIKTISSLIYCEPHKIDFVDTLGTTVISKTIMSCEELAKIYELYEGLNVPENKMKTFIGKISNKSERSIKDITDDLIEKKIFENSPLSIKKIFSVIGRYFSF